MEAYPKSRSWPIALAIVVVVWAFVVSQHTRFGIVRSQSNSLLTNHATRPAPADWIDIASSRSVGSHRPAPSPILVSDPFRDFDSRRGSSASPFRLASERTERYPVPIPRRPRATVPTRLVSQITKKALPAANDMGVSPEPPMPDLRPGGGQGVKLEAGSNVTRFDLQHIPDLELEVVSPDNFPEANSDNSKTAVGDDQPTHLDDETTNQSEFVSWPAPQALVQQLNDLRPTGITREISDWIDQVLREIDRMQSHSLDQPSAWQPSLQKLVRLADDPSVHEPRVADPTVAADVRRTGYALVRRVAIWQDLQRVLAQPAVPDAPKSSIKLTAQRLHEAFTKSANGETWIRYLELQRILEADASQYEVDPSIRTKVARRVLTKLATHQLSPQQRAFLDQHDFHELQDSLAIWAEAPLDAVDLLTAMENFESYRSPVASDYLVREIQQLAWVRHPQIQSLRASLDQHYRNANVRLVVTGELLNHMMPVLKPIQEKVEDHVLGARVLGRNDTWTQLSVSLIPDQTQWRMRLSARGQATFNTVSYKGPVRLFSRGRSEFAADQQLSVSPQGVSVTPAGADANGRSQLLDVETEYDRFPVLGWVIRQLAIDEHRESRNKVQAHMRDKVSSAARQRLHEAVDTRATELEAKFQQDVLTPLREMNLDPRAIEMKTTPERLTMRCRLASPNQLAASTPRPRALANSLMSLQIHQSAVNNAIERLELGGRKVELELLLAELRQKLGIDRQDIHQDLPQDVTLRLAQVEPIRFEFSDNRVLLVFRIAELHVGQKQWRNFIVKARYRADFCKTHVDLQREGGIELISERIGFRDRIALRGIFTKVTSGDHRFSILRGRFEENPRLAQMEPTQFVAEDGWIGLSLGVPKEDRVAQEPTVRQLENNSRISR
ncbi:MAG: hypothetical protein KDA87_07690 [Planctomycetales bacterium]|nr:hypothetical protein [Planctomycetales bacterium]